MPRLLLGIAFSNRGNVAVIAGNKLSIFSAMVTFLQVKTSERMTNKSFDAMLAAFCKSFPDVSVLPHTLIWG